MCSGTSARDALREYQEDYLDYLMWERGQAMSRHREMEEAREMRNSPEAKAAARATAAVRERQRYAEDEFHRAKHRLRARRYNAEKRGNLILAAEIQDELNTLTRREMEEEITQLINDHGLPPEVAADWATMRLCWGRPTPERMWKTAFLAGWEDEHENRRGKRGGERRVTRLRREAKWEEKGMLDDYRKGRKSFDPEEFEDYRRRIGTKWNLSPKWRRLRKERERRGDTAYGLLVEAERKKR